MSQVTSKLCNRRIHSHSKKRHINESNVIDAIDACIYIEVHVPIALKRELSAQWTGEDNSIGTKRPDELEIWGTRSSPITDHWRMIHCGEKQNTVLHCIVFFHCFGLGYLIWIATFLSSGFVIQSPNPKTPTAIVRKLRIKWKKLAYELLNGLTQPLKCLIRLHSLSGLISQLISSSLW